MERAVRAVLDRMKAAQAFVIERFAARNRAMDMDFLWPSILGQAKTKTAAYDAFYLHVRNSRAWRGWSRDRMVKAIMDGDLE